MGNMCYINHSGKYFEINFNMKIPFQLLYLVTKGKLTAHLCTKISLRLSFSFCIIHIMLTWPVHTFIVCITSHFTWGIVH